MATKRIVTTKRSGTKARPRAGENFEARGAGPGINLALVPAYRRKVRRIRRKGGGPGFYATNAIDRSLDILGRTRCGTIPNEEVWAFFDALKMLRAMRKRIEQAQRHEVAKPQLRLVIGGAS